MAPRILFELILFLLPFMLFGLYRLAVREAEHDGRKPWPIRLLFGIGLILAVGVWMIFILLDRGGREECYRAARMDNGTLIPGETYACEKDLTTIGIPRTEDPGGVASGVGFGSEPEPEPEAEPAEQPAAGDDGEN